MVKSHDNPSQFAAFQGGSRMALGYYFGRYGDKIFHYLDNKTEDAGVAKELTAKVFATAYEKRERFGNEAQLRPCFFQIARRLAQAHLWDKARIHKIEIDLLFRLDGGCSVFEDAQQQRVEVLTELRRSFLKLTPWKRRILVYYFFRKMSTREIALRLGIGTQTALNHKSQALHFMKNDFWGKWGENNPFLA